MTDATWILVCDSSRARLFSTRPKETHLHLVQAFEHPEGRLPNHELVSDRPGRAQQAAAPSHSPGTAGIAKGSRSGMEPHTSPKTVEQEHFAHALAAALHKGLVDNAYQHVVLVAPPQFLGILRNVLDPQVHKHVQHSLDKDYAQLDERELSERLRPLLVPPQ